MKLIFFLLLLIGPQLHCSDHFPGYHNHSHCQHAQRDQLPLEVPRDIPNYCKIASSNTDFAYRLYNLIVTNGTDKNVFFSPLSISTIFALLTLGAKGETFNQINKALAFNLSEIEEKEIHDGFRQLTHVLNHPHKQAQVNIGNALFINDSFTILPKFLEDTKTWYNAKAFSVNFGNTVETKKQINAYVAEKTHGKIAHAIDHLAKYTAMLMLNYIFFKGYWKIPFDSKYTSEEDFFVNATTTVKVDMMFQKGYYKVLHDEDAFSWVVEIPYKGHASAWFLLPSNGKLNDVEGSLENNIFSKWMAKVRYRYIELRVPKCSVTTSYSLKKLMKELGVTDVFNGNADLSGITGRSSLSVSEVTHKAALNIWENGTEAAAVTVIKFMTGPAQIPSVITFNRPHLLIITDNPTQSIIFMGKIMNPNDS
ncbi:alpha-1-antitrypsin-like [Hemicordylus capensis]|uniref:alpha-1-antitrypsin-like n=1 Tax=Hemicordylus capensis TaxID=884348 RepID=UPI002302A34F|nr:alpha-1-antitrypsin-like [Hemicordylus capensis]